MKVYSPKWWAVQLDTYINKKEILSDQLIERFETHQNMIDDFSRGHDVRYETDFKGETLEFLSSNATSDYFVYIPTRKINCEIPLQETDKPKLGSRYYYISLASEYGVDTDIWDDHPADIAHLKNKSLFLKKEDAKTAFIALFGGDV